MERRAAGDRAAPAPWRWPVDAPASVQEHRSCALDIRIIDLSRSGCRIWAGFRLKPGRRAKLRIKDFAPLDATIIWSENWAAALHFDQPLSPAVLRHLVARYPATEDVAISPPPAQREQA